MGMEYVKARLLALRRGMDPNLRRHTERITDSRVAYPDAFEDEIEEDFFTAENVKISRPLSEPGSPRDRSGMMTPGDFASLQEGREGLSTEDYIAWKLP